MQLKRSWLFVPGHSMKMMTKAKGLTVDAVMLDIEDGVIPENKPTARQLIPQMIEEFRDPATPTCFVRVNAVGYSDFEEDLQAVIREGLEGIVLPKVERPEQVRYAEERVASLERERGLEEGTIKFLAAVESPIGLINALAIARASQRVIGLMMGAEDFGLEMRLPTNREKEARELLYARSALAVAAAAANVQAVDGVWPDFKDLEGLERDSLQARRLGFTGKSLFHPGQIEVINRVFSPSPGDIDLAQRVIEAFEQAKARGDGAVAFGGQLIDKPIADRAYQTIEMARKLGLI